MSSTSALSSECGAPGLQGTNPRLDPHLTALRRVWGSRPPEHKPSARPSPHCLQASVGLLASRAQTLSQTLTSVPSGERGAPGPQSTNPQPDPHLSALRRAWGSRPPGHKPSARPSPHCPQASVGLPACGTEPQARPSPQCPQASVGFPACGTEPQARPSPQCPQASVGLPACRCAGHRARKASLLGLPFVHMTEKSAYCLPSL